MATATVSAVFIVHQLARQKKNWTHREIPDAQVLEANASTTPTTAVGITRLVFVGDQSLDNAAPQKKIPIHQLTSEVIISTVTKDTSSAVKSLVKTFRH